MRKFKKLFVFLLSLCCLFTNIMGSSLTTVSAATQVKVELVGNGGTFDISGTGASMTGTEYQHHEEMIDVGSNLSASNITISDPVSSNGWTFIGWEVFDNTDPSKLEFIDGGITTADMHNYTIPNHNILFRACWDTSTGNGGNQGGGNQGGGNQGGGNQTPVTQVMICADGGDFDFTDMSGSGRTNWTYFWVVSGSSLSADGYDISDAYKQGYIFKGWLECTYTIDSTTNMPICTPVANAALLSTVDVLNYTIPTNGTGFIAQYDVDTRTFVDVFFNGNEGTFAFNDDGYAKNDCEVYGNRYLAGSTVAAENPNLTISNPVFWNSNRAFTGWLACEKVKHTEPDGRIWESMEQIAGTSLMTTAEAFAYTIPSKDLYFMAQYAGDDADYYSNVRINGYGAPFTYEEYYWNNNQQQSNIHSTEGWGSYLKEDGTSIATQCKDRFAFKNEPSKSGATFEGWMEFKIETKINKLGNEYEDYILVSQTLLTTNDMLNRVVPSYDVAYVAKWSDMSFDDYYQWINITNVGFSAEPGRFYFEDPAHGITGEYFNGANWGYEKGETLASLGVVVKDPTAIGYIFKGWKVCSVEFTQNGPVFTQLPNTSLITTTDALNYMIPDYNIFFVAEWEKDARPIVNVCFEGNGGEFEVEFNQDKFPATFFGDEYVVGTTAADAGLKISDPVFWEKTRAFVGWEVCQWVEHKDDAGNPWFDMEKVPGTSILTTAQALAYPIPDYEIVFMAKWAGNDDDYYSQVFINGYGVEFTFEEGFWNEQNQQQEFRPVNTEVWGNYLRQDGTSLADQTQDNFKLSSEPSKAAATFEGWLEFKVDITIDENGYWHEEYTLVNDTLYTTAQMLAKKIPVYDVAYVAKWSDVPLKEYFAKETALFLNANKGEIALNVVDENGQQITIKTTASECYYPNCYTVAEGFKMVDWEFVDITKQCAVLTGWTVYSFDSYSFVEMPAGQELNVGDPEVTFVYFDTYTDDNGNSFDRYLGMENARMEFGAISTNNLLAFKGIRNYHYAVANWQEAHTPAPYVIENNVEPTEGTDGSYDKVIYCSKCSEELDRETIITTFTSQTVKVEGSDDSFKADTKSALTEVPSEIADKFETVADVEKALEDTAKTANEKFDDEKVKIEVVDVELKVFNEETNAWEIVDDTNFPENGVTIVLPYPEGINTVNYANFTFEIVHMITSGEKAGQTEVLSPVFKADGIHVTVTSLSPIGIVYQENPKVPVVNKAPSYVAPPVESEHTLANGEEVRMITVEDDSTIYVIGNRNLVPTGASFECENVTSGTQFDAAAKAVAKKFGSVNYKVFDFNLFNAHGQKMSKLNGYVNVSMSIPNGMVTRDGDTIVVYALQNGKLVKCDTAVANGQVTFATNHFSTYILVEINTMTSPKTDDVSMLPMLTMLMFVMFASSVVIMRKKFNS